MMKECPIRHGLRRVRTLYRRPFVRHVVIAASGATGVEAVGSLLNLTLITAVLRKSGSDFKKARL